MRKGKWHIWFAWRPVALVDSGRIAWWEYIECALHEDNEGDDYFVYREWKRR